MFIYLLKYVYLNVYICEYIYIYVHIHILSCRQMNDGTIKEIYQPSLGQ